MHPSMALRTETEAYVEQMFGSEAMRGSDAEGMSWSIADSRPTYLAKFVHHLGVDACPQPKRQSLQASVT